MGAIHRTNYRVSFGRTGLGIGITGLLVLFWTSVWLQRAGYPTTGLRVATGLLVLFVPGVLLTQTLDVGTDTGGVFALFVAGLGLATLAIITVVANLILPLAGVDRPLSFLPFAVLLTITVVALFVVASTVNGEFSGFPITLVGSAPVLLLVFSLPTIASLGAVVMRRTGSNAVMFLFIALVAVVVLLSSTSYLSANLYPVVVYAVALSTLLHVNLVTQHVVGNDIQGLYFLAERLLDTGSWSPGNVPSGVALPVVTSVPVMIVEIAGIRLETAFTVVFVVLFALVPVGIYYVGIHAFEPKVGLYGALFFSFYHISFTYTPEKQLLAELFVVALLVLFFVEGFGRTGSRVAAVVLAVGLVFSHYGTTYVFALSLFAGTVALVVGNRFFESLDHRLSLAYPVALVAMGTGWYAFVSPELAARLAAVPLGTLEQLVTIVTTGRFVGGSGASYVQRQETLLEDVTLYLYVLFTVLLTVGLAWTTLDHFRRARREEPTDHVELTALALPMFALLASSYVIILGLYADRVYQMVLPVLAPFMVVGYAFLARGGGFLDGKIRLSWSLVAALLVVLLAFNSGLAFSVLYESERTAFNENAHDSAFTRAERAGGEWLKQYGGIEPLGAYQPGNKLETRERPNQVPIFVDSVSYQMFRSILPTHYYSAELVVLKNEWQPEIRFELLDEGYVYVRESGVADRDSEEPVDPTTLSAAEADVITVPRNVIYSSGEARIVTAENGAVGNSTTADLENE